ncbi:MAG: hypothetical protein WCK40_07460 [Thermoleophilia bacterium]
MKITTGRIALAAALAAGIPLVAAGCGDSTPAASATTTEVVTETTAPAPAATTAAATPAAASALPAAPSGAKQLASRQKNGATYYHYSISGQTPQQIVNGYQTELKSSGFTVKSTGGGGGGWGAYGGSEAGISADNNSEWIDVEAGGQKSGPTYWEVCVGPSNQSVNDCQDVEDSSSNQS